MTEGDEIFNREEYISKIETFFDEGTFDPIRATAAWLIKELRAGDDEIKALKFNLKQKEKEIGRAEHHGNTVNYIYDKLENYSRQLVEIGPKLTEMTARHDAVVEKLRVAKGALGLVCQCRDWNSHYNAINNASEALRKLEGEP